jgi:hypothetical protein
LSRQTSDTAVKPHGDSESSPPEIKESRSMGPKKGSSSGGKKPAPPTAPPGEDDSFIVFGDKKPKKKPNPSDAIKDHEAGTVDGVKKPDTRTLIGGASWTGKLPVNILSEHCQKQHWQKPEYTMVDSLPFVLESVSVADIAIQSIKPQKASLQW